MKENSVEEDIINAQHFINSIKTDKDYKDENGWHGYYNREIVELVRILDHILSAYKRVLKENEELKKFHIQDNKHLDFIMQHSIPVQKVKDKISERQFELQQEYKDFEDGICTWNMFAMIQEIFELEDDEYISDVFYKLRKNLINYKEIDDAYENLGLERSDT